MEKKTVSSAGRECLWEKMESDDDFPSMAGSFLKVLKQTLEFISGTLLGLIRVGYGWIRFPETTSTLDFEKTREP